MVLVTFVRKATEGDLTMYTSQMVADAHAPEWTLHFVSHGYGFDLVTAQVTLVRLAQKNKLSQSSSRQVLFALEDLIDYNRVDVDPDIPVLKPFPFRIYVGVRDRDLHIMSVSGEVGAAKVQGSFDTSHLSRVRVTPSVNKNNSGTSGIYTNRPSQTGQSVLRHIINAVPLSRRRAVSLSGTNKGLHARVSHSQSRQFNMVFKDGRFSESDVKHSLSNRIPLCVGSYKTSTYIAAPVDDRHFVLVDLMKERVDGQSNCYVLLASRLLSSAYQSVSPITKSGYVAKLERAVKIVQIYIKKELPHESCTAVRTAESVLLTSLALLK